MSEDLTPVEPVALETEEDFIAELRRAVQSRGKEFAEGLIAAAIHDPLQADRLLKLTYGTLAKLEAENTVDEVEELLLDRPTATGHDKRAVRLRQNRATE